MADVADLERFLERVFERTSARLFRSRVQVVHVERRVERAMEAGRSGRGAATSVPSRYGIRLNPVDLDDLATRTGGLEVLAARLADRALTFARLHGYHLAARPVVSVVGDPALERGRIEVDASEAKPAGAPPRSSSRPADAWSSGAILPAPGAPVVPPAGRLWGPPDAAIATSDEAAATPEADAADERTGRPPFAPIALPSSVDEVASGGGPSWTVPSGSAEPNAEPDAPPPAREAPAAASSLPPALPSLTPDHHLRAGAERPYAVRPAAPPPSRALLRVLEPGGREREVRVSAEPLTLGRATDNSLVIADARVSRHHGRFQTRHGTLVYTDLGSTNGTRVNGIRVDEIVLGPGDRLQLGDVVVVVEQLPG